MAHFVRAYLRASTKEQDAERAKRSLEDFAEVNNLDICSFYSENESGAKLHRPELFRLLDDCRSGDILLIEDIDRLSRLNSKDWDKLKAVIKNKNVHIVAVNVPMTHSILNSSNDANDFDKRMIGAMGDMMIDMLAAVSRRDYEQRRERQAQGIVKAKAEGKFKGRKTDYDLYKSIVKLVKSEHTYKEIIKLLGTSSRTISKAKKWSEEQKSVKLKNSST